MTEDIFLRRGGPDDHVLLGEIMFDAVRNGPSPYSEGQRRAWVAAPRAGADWDARLAGQHIIIAERGGNALGFMTLSPPDYVDFAYLRPHARGQGIFRRLHEAIELEARRAGQGRLHVHASLMAQPAFAAMGYDIVKAEQVNIGGETLDRFAMEKHLTDETPPADRTA